MAGIDADIDTSPRRVVYDVNVFLRVAEQLGPNAWTELPSSPSRAPAGGLAEQQCLAIAREGIFAAPLALELWTSEHITDLVVAKLIQAPEDEGFGWGEDDARRFADQILDVVYATHGRETHGQEIEGPDHAEGPPQLGNEDGRVLATAWMAGAHYLVTGDREFAMQLHPRWRNIEVMAPNQWVAWVAKWRRVSSQVRGG